MEHAAELWTAALAMRIDQERGAIRRSLTGTIQFELAPNGDGEYLWFFVRVAGAETKLLRGRNAEYDAFVRIDQRALAAQLSRSDEVALSLDTWGREESRKSSAPTPTTCADFFFKDPVTQAPPCATSTSICSRERTTKTRSRSDAD
jgi:hypothetical protein